MRVKRIGCALLCAALLCAVCGCNTIEQASQPEPEDKITLNFWEIDWSGSDSLVYGDRLAKLLAEYGAQHPNIDIHFQLIPQEDAYEVFRTAAVAGTEPDLCSSHMAQPIYFASLRQTLDLGPILDAWEAEQSPVLQEIDDAYFQIYTYEDALTAIPFGLDCRVLYYREDYFESAGIHTPPNTVEEFSEAFEKLQTTFPESTPFLFSADTTFSATASSLFFLSMNGAKSETSALDAVITGRNAISAYRILDGWIDEGYIPALPLQLSDEDVRKSFLSGGACMILTQPIVAWLNEADLYSVCSVSNTPAGPFAIRGYTYYSPVCYQGFNTTEHPNEVRDLIKWLVEHNETLFTEGKSCVLPIRASYADTLSGVDKNIAEIYAMISRYGRMSNYPHSVIYPFQYVLQNEGILGDPLIDTLSGVDVLEALSKADQEYQQILESYGY
uniref:Putative extracellular solutebinding protein family 1 n=1 Tax=termite gut metagenome TaxID=433724 RepID=S0DG06_9ZZZZ